MRFDFNQPNETENINNILDVNIPQEIENAIPTGHNAIDAMFAGDGIIPSTCCLLTGTPGSGKTTLAIELADCITGTGNVCLYNTGEESLYQVRRVTKRLNLRHGFVPSQYNCVDDIIERLTELKTQHTNKQIFFIQDSLQCLTPSKFDIETGLVKKGRPKVGQNSQVDSVMSLIKYIKESFGIMILIGMVTKEGVFAGKNELKHMLDCHLHLGINMNKRSDNYGERIASMAKNRFGIAGTEYVFDLTSSGLKFEIFSNVR